MCLAALLADVRVALLLLLLLLLFMIPADGGGNIRVTLAPIRPVSVDEVSMQVVPASKPTSGAGFLLAAGSVSGGGAVGGWLLALRCNIVVIVLYVALEAVLDLRVDGESSLDSREELFPPLLVDRRDGAHCHVARGPWSSEGELPLHMAGKLSHAGGLNSCAEQRATKFPSAEAEESTTLSAVAREAAARDVLGSVVVEGADDGDVEDGVGFEGRAFGDAVGGDAHESIDIVRKEKACEGMIVIPAHASGPVDMLVASGGKVPPKSSSHRECDLCFQVTRAP
eukprot:CAMPEP_0174714726 /NCGR_PEP_ID=MMETSP1094-20130205/18936_1 /TAXON_ID=156173 /ORGANISM="Chrysochromulina brevifilum, Strain UTEX LB 985" /LENGTH=282 /DNA_ID=CAMNT_0015914141 /DNA_START=369 /DNA_END=1221 /DNA_ORIENTATION=+